MDWIVIDGVAPWDGRYELDLNEQPLTTREWGWAKRYAGVLPVMVDENTLTDPEMITLLAIVALRRNGKVEINDVPDLWERLQDVPFGSTITFEGGPVDEDDAGPPPQKTDSRANSNGEGSPTDSETQVLRPSPTGSPPWATSGSDPVTSGT